MKCAAGSRADSRAGSRADSRAVANSVPCVGAAAGANI